MSDNRNFLSKFGSGSVKNSFIIIIVMTTILAGTSISGIVIVQNNYDNLVNDSFETLDLNQRLQKNLLQAREADSDFRNFGDLSMTQDVIDYVNASIDNGNQIVSIGVNQDIVDYAKESMMHIRMYNDTFASLSEKLITRGGGVFASDTGMVAETVNHTGHVEGFISSLVANNVINDTVENEFLLYSSRLNTHLQGYLLNFQDGSETSEMHVENFNSTFDEFIVVIEDSDSINATMKSHFKHHLNMYRNSFMSVIAMDMEIRQDTMELGHHVMMTEIEASNLNNAALEAKSVAVNETNQVVRTIIITTIIMFLVVIGLSILLSSSTTKNIINPIDSMNKEVQEIAKGDLTREPGINGNATKEISVLSHNLETMVTQLSSLVNDINNNSDEINNTSLNVASAAEEVSASIEEMSNTTEQMSVGASEQAEMIQHVLQELINSEETIIDIIEAVQSNTNFVAEIAQETKYLALNARIEASRAGASGRGFSVVAEDVRSLSEQSKMASEEISKTVENISQSLTSLFSNIVDKIDNISSVSEETAASAEELASITEEISANMEEVSTSSHVLNEMAESSKATVSQFKVKQ